MSAQGEHQGALDITLDDAVPGMMLADDLYDGHGSVLLPAGVALTVANLASLRRRGVVACRIAGAGAGADAGESETGQPAQKNEQEQQKEQEKEQERRRLRLARQFRGSAGIGASAVLLQLLLAYRRGD